MDEQKAEDSSAEPKLNLHFNNAEFGGKVLYKDDQITVVPTAIMQERVTNGAMKLYDEFKDSVHWWKNKPIIPPHKPGDPPVNHRTKIAGKVLDAWLNPDLKRIDGVALFYNARIAPDDLKRIWEGEKFGNSPGYYCNDEALPGTWEGVEFKTTERGPYYPDHLSMVPRGACPLPHCGFSVDVPVDEARIARLLDGLKLNFGVIEMTEEVKTEPEIKANAEVAPTINVEPPQVNVAVDLTAVLTEMKSMRSDFAELKANISTKDAEISALKAAEELRANAAKEQAEQAAKAGFRSILKANFQAEVETLYPAYVANPAMWIVTNAEKIDLAQKATVEPIGQAFVPHVNIEEDEELKAMMPSDEQAGLRKVA